MSPQSKHPGDSQQRWLWGLTLAPRWMVIPRGSEGPIKDHLHPEPYGETLEGFRRGRLCVLNWFVSRSL